MHCSAPNAALALVVALALAAVPPAAAMMTDSQVEAKRAEFDAEYQALIDNSSGQSAAQRLEALFDLGHREAMFENPIWAAMTGEPSDRGRWGDSSLAADERGKKRARQTLAVLDAIDPSELDEAGRLDYDLFRRQVERRIEGERFPDDVLVIDQMGGPQRWLPQMFVQIPARNADEYEDVITWMRGVPEQLANVRERLELGLEKGVTPPKVTLADVANQIAAQAVENPEDSPIYQRFASLPDSIPAADRERLQAEAKRVIAEEVAPAFRDLRDFWVEEYYPKTRDSIAMSELPDGEAWYAFNVKRETTTDLTPREIHEIGLAEVKRIRGEMDAIIAKTGFEGSFDEFLEFLRTDDRFFFDTPEELLAGYRDIAKRIDPHLVELFGKLPRLPYGVAAVPSYSEKSQTTAYYQPGNLEAGIPGYFTANTYDLASRPKWEMEALTAHEAVPGHHLQISIAGELEDVPEFRKRSGTTAFVEGWALYAESLGDDIGLYQDPYSKFGQLTYEMWRAIRLVVDTGMHSLGWTREQAIDYFLASSGKAEHDIRVEIDRYIVWPGQALAYKMGELKIKELRADAEKELGPAFDVRAFHDTVLGNGAVPLDVLEEQVHAWVAEEKAGGADQPAAGQ